MSHLKPAEPKEAGLLRRTADPAELGGSRDLNDDDFKLRGRLSNLTPPLHEEAAADPFRCAMDGGAGAPTSGKRHEKATPFWGCYCYGFCLFRWYQGIERESREREGMGWDGVVGQIDRNSKTDRRGRRTQIGFEKLGPTLPYSSHQVFVFKLSRQKEGIVIYYYDFTLKLSKCR